MEEDMEDFEYLGDGNWGKAESDSDDSSDDDETDRSDVDEDSEDSEKKENKRPKKKKSPRTGKGSRIEIEYEEENEMQEEPMQEAGMAW